MHVRMCVWVHLLIELFQTHTDSACVGCIQYLSSDPVLVDNMPRRRTPPGGLLSNCQVFRSCCRPCEFTSSVPSVVHACVRVFVRELSSCIDTATRFQAARRTQTVRTLTVDSWLIRIAGPEKAKAADQA